MGWQHVNSKLVQDDIDNLGYLVGTGNEDGYYCFYHSPYVYYSDGPFISDSFLPHLEVADSPYTIVGVTYGPVTGSNVNGRVWANGGPHSGAQYVFNSRGNGWIRFDYLREPQYYLDIDGETMVGDLFYGGNFPQLNDATPTEWTLQGAVNDDPDNPGHDTSGYDSSISVYLKQNLWLWQTNGDWNKTKSGLCGKYYNQVDGSYKSVGMPAYQATDTSETSPFKDEIFLRAENRDSNNKLIYEGNNGHTIHYDKTSQKWIVGTIGQNHWSEGPKPPSIKSPVSFTGKKMNEHGTEETDQDWDFTLEWKHFEPGNSKKQIYMGEVSLWR